MGTAAIHFAVSCEQSRLCPEYPGPEYYPLSSSATSCLFLFAGMKIRNSKYTFCLFCLSLSFCVLSNKLSHCDTRLQSLAPAGIAYQNMQSHSNHAITFAGNPFRNGKGTALSACTPGAVSGATRCCVLSIHKPSGTLTNWCTDFYMVHSMSFSRHQVLNQASRTGKEAFGSMFETCKLCLGKRANSIKAQC